MTRRLRQSVCRLFLATALLAPMAAFVSTAATPIRYTNLFNRHYVYLADVAKYYGMSIKAIGKQCFLTSKYSKLVFNHDKRVCEINGTCSHLMFPAFFNKGNPMISEQDFLTLVDPIMRPAAVPKHGLKTIMIDPGHGGRDIGGAGSIHREKDITLKTANYLADYLRRRGYRVVMTRNSDTTIGLKSRTELCVQHRPDIFVSIHCNVAGTKSVSGIETFIATPKGAPSTSSSKPEWKQHPGNNHDPRNSRLGYEIQKSLVKTVKAKDRGLKHARFVVIREMDCPAVLIETGFLSNRAEEKMLANPAYQRRLAWAVAEGIDRYAKVAMRKK